MLVYVAGPYTPTNGKTIEQNIDNAADLAYWVWEAGMTAICPHKNTQGFDDLGADRFYMGNLDILERCDAVIMVDGWEKSFGAKMERIIASRNGIPVFYDLSDLLRYYVGEGMQ